MAEKSMIFTELLCEQRKMIDVRNKIDFCSKCKEEINKYIDDLGKEYARLVNETGVVT